MFILAGLIMVVSIFTGLSWPVFITVVTLAALVPFVYSLLLYRKLHGFEVEED